MEQKPLSGRQLSAVGEFLTRHLPMGHTCGDFLAASEFLYDQARENAPLVVALCLQSADLTVRSIRRQVSKLPFELQDEALNFILDHRNKMLAVRIRPGRDNGPRSESP